MSPAFHPRPTGAVLLLLLSACGAPGGGGDAKPGSGPRPPLVDPPPVPASEGREDRPQETWSLFGIPLLRPSPDPRTLEGHEREYARALARWQRDPSETAAIELGASLVQLGRLSEALNHYLESLNRHPRSAALRFHLGTCTLALRRFDLAEETLRTARAWVPDEVQPVSDPGLLAGDPPPDNIQSAVLRNLGLARYVAGDWEGALEAWGDEVTWLSGEGARANAAWRVQALWRLERFADAEALLGALVERPGTPATGASARLLACFAGRLPPDGVRDPLAPGTAESSRLAYGLACWHRHHGRLGEADQLLRAILAGPRWDELGYVAAEADLWRASQPSHPSGL